MEKCDSWLLSMNKMGVSMEARTCDSKTAKIEKNPSRSSTTAKIHNSSATCPPFRKCSLKYLCRKIKNGKECPVADTFIAKVTSVPFSLEVTRPICYTLRLLITLLDVSTVIISVSSMFRI